MVNEDSVRKTRWFDMEISLNERLDTEIRASICLSIERVPLLASRPDQFKIQIQNLRKSITAAAGVARDAIVDDIVYFSQYNTCLQRCINGD